MSGEASPPYCGNGGQKVFEVRKTSAESDLETRFLQKTGFLKKFNQV
jgi:hypothetical protein